MSPRGVDYIFTLPTAGARRVVSEGSMSAHVERAFTTSLLIARTAGFSLPILSIGEYRSDARGFQHIAEFFTHRYR